MTDYDVIIIGSGAGGSTVARTLADTGKRILLLERGDFLTREKRNWDPDFIFDERGYQIEEAWYDEVTREEFLPQAFYKVGGNTKVYGSVLMRMRAEDFGEQRWPDGVSPAWPLDYAARPPGRSRSRTVQPASPSAAFAKTPRPRRRRAPHRRWRRRGRARAASAKI